MARRCVTPCTGAPSFVSVQLDAAAGGILGSGDSACSTLHICNIWNKVVVDDGRPAALCSTGSHVNMAALKLASLFLTTLTRTATVFMTFKLHRLV